MDRDVGLFKAHGATISFANGKSRVFPALIEQAIKVDRVRLVVLTAKPPTGDRNEPNLFCVDGDGWGYWASPQYAWSRGHYVRMDVLRDRISLATDEEWSVGLLLPHGRLLNEWRAADGPRYVVEDRKVMFTGGGVAEFGSQVMETIDAGSVVVVRTERGPAGSPAENVAAVNEQGQVVWRVPKHRWANNGRPVPYDAISRVGDRVQLYSSIGFRIDLDPLTGSVLREEITR